MLAFYKRRQISTIQ